jgi:hypothetical protein
MNQLILNICIITVAVALYKMLVPDGAYAKQIGFLITCFFIAGIAGFFGSGAFDVGSLKQAFSDGSSYVDFSKQLTETRKRAIADELSARVRETLESGGIECRKIYTIVNISGLYGISISEIELVLPAGEDEAAAKALAQRSVGSTIAVSVIVESETNSDGSSNSAKITSGVTVSIPAIPEVNYVD